MLDWSRYPNFTEAEMACKHTGMTGVKPELMEHLQALRNEVGALDVSSGYRAVAHPVEASKSRAGARRSITPTSPRRSRGGSATRATPSEDTAARWRRSRGDRTRPR